MHLHSNHVVFDKTTLPFFAPTQLYGNNKIDGELITFTDWEAPSINKTYASLISGFSPPATNIIPSRSPTVDTLPTMTTPRYLNFHVARVTHNIPIVPKSIIFAKCQPRWVAAMDEKSCCPKCKSGPHGTGTSP